MHRYACANPSQSPEPCSPASYSLGDATNCSACPAGKQSPWSPATRFQNHQVTCAHRNRPCPKLARKGLSRSTIGDTVSSAPVAFRAREAGMNLSRVWRERRAYQVQRNVRLATLVATQTVTLLSAASNVHVDTVARTFLQHHRLAKMARSHQSESLLAMRASKELRVSRPHRNVKSVLQVMRANAEFLPSLFVFHILFSRCLNASRSPVKCEIGSYSERGFTSCIACEIGTCSSDDNSRCIAAQPGFHCGFPTLGQRPCSEGKYSLGGNVSACEPIPEGFFAVSAYSRPRLCPAGTISPVGVSVCSPCPSGFACPSPDAPAIACSAGFYALNGSTQCDPCPAGYSCESSSESPVRCPLGSYSLAAQIKCTECPAGSKCTSPSEVPSSCALGTFSLGNSTDCHVCPAGYMCPGVNAYPLMCPSATYSSAGATDCTTCPYGFMVTSNRTRCDICPVGSYCPYVDREIVIRCPVGTYSTGAQSSCTACAPGWACPYTDRATKTPCDLGTYSDAGQASCTLCPAGFQCPASTSSSLILCGLGTYSSLGDPYCHECPSGFFCLTPSDGPTRCPSGTYSSVQSSNCTICPAGYKCENPETPPAKCPVGFWSQSGATTCSECYAGYHCSEGSTSPAPYGDEAPVGTYSNPSSILTLCPLGTYGSKVGGTSQDDACILCEPSYFCPMLGTTFTSRTLCPRGFFCEQGSAFPTPCPAGKFSDEFGAASIATCMSCPAGFYCQAETASKTLSLCIEGHFCPSSTSSWSQFPCPAGSFSSQTGLHDATQCERCIVGHFCPEGSTAPTVCPVGTYNPHVGARTSSACLSCEAGWSCPTPGTWAMRESCLPGHYCPPGTAYPNQFPCLAGTYSDVTNLTDSSECKACPAGGACASGSTSTTIEACEAGWYCPQGSGTTTPHPCPPGRWSNKTNLASSGDCSTCPAGYYCNGGEGSVSGPCTAGYVCPVGSSSTTSIPCPAGRYSTGTNLYSIDQCTVCPVGSYCPEASVSETSCPAGRFSPNNATQGAGPIRCESFPSVCTDSATDCIDCLGGSKCLVNSVEPTACGVGFFSSDGASDCSTCEAGHYCGSNTTNLSSMISGGGDWSNTEDLAGRCFDGTWCPEGMESAPNMAKNACPRGNYCPSGTQYPLACPAGKYLPSEGGASESDCIVTPQGYYTISGASNLTGLCDPGYFCGLGSTGPRETPCPDATYNPYYGRATSDDCSLCVSGGYCPQASSHPNVCPRGYYCPTGVSEASPCPGGTFGNESGLRREEDCVPCLPGFYCDGTGLPRPRGMCAPGHYCIEGSNTSSPNSDGAPRVPASVGGVCPIGGYCPVGSSYPTACPAGTFGNTSGLASPDECANCLAGFYCAGSNNPYPTGQCYAGYFCLSASTSPTQYECAAGKYSTIGSSECTDCPAGKWQPYRAQSSCVDSPAGYYSDTLGATSYKDCPQGYYCPAGTSDFAIFPCPAGTFGGRDLLQSVSECTPCTAGNFCDEYHLVEPSGKCAAGFFCSEGAFDKEGQFCFDLDIYEADYDPATDSNLTEINATRISYLVDCEDDGGPCTVGHFCLPGEQKPISPSTHELTGAGYPEPCPLGTYNPYKQNSDECTPCDPGYACDTTGLSSPVTVCAPGYFCKNENNSASSATPICVEESCLGDYGICPAGYSCRNQTIEPEVCAPGRYAPMEGLEACLECAVFLFRIAATVLQVQRVTFAMEPKHTVTSLVSLLVVRRMILYRRSAWVLLSARHRRNTANVPAGKIRPRLQAQDRP